MKGESKFHSKKITLPTGEVFDSKLEYERWNFLKAMILAGKVKDLERQVTYVLLPKQTKSSQPIGKNGTLLKPKVRVVERECTYKADFVYKALVDPVFNIWATIVEDTKGFKTPEYRLKKKMMLYFHAVEIQEIKKAIQPIKTSV